MWSQCPAVSYSISCSLNTLEWLNINSKYDSPQPMIPPIKNVWSIWGKERLESQQRHELEKVFASAIVFKWLFWAQVQGVNAK